jgi:type IV secretory pathway VirJ component
MPAARRVVLPNVGHDSPNYAFWLPQLETAAAQFATRNRSVPVLGAQVDGLPLVEVRAQGAGDTLAVIITGDGGWASIDKSLGEAFAEAGIPVVGLDSVRYFWKKREPDQAGEDLARIARHYLAAWGKEKLLLVGYSSGADVLPFMARRLPADLLASVKMVVLLSPAKQASFEFHISQWIGSTTPDARPVKPEVAKLAGTRVLCIYGDQETDTLCPELGAGLASAKRLGGGHHYGRDFRALASEILKAAE